MASANTKILATVFALSSGLAQSGAAKAEPGTVTICTASGPMIPVCATVGVLALEVVQALNDKQAFAPNGEIMKVLAAPVKIVASNVKGAERESGEIAKILRATIGISIRDINDYGIWGGPNSIFRKPFG
jgi:hypothetical protein